MEDPAVQKLVIQQQISNLMQQKLGQVGPFVLLAISILTLVWIIGIPLFIASMWWSYVRDKHDKCIDAQIDTLNKQFAAL